MYHAYVLVQALLTHTHAHTRKVATHAIGHDEHLLIQELIPQHPAPKLIAVLHTRESYTRRG